MKQNITYAILAIVCFVFAYGHFQGNVSLVHSYHKSRIAQKDMIAYAKTFGVGMLIIGVGCTLALLLRLLQLYLFSDIIMFIGIFMGVLVMIYAQFKYNHGIF